MKALKEPKLSKKVLLEQTEDDSQSFQNLDLSVTNKSETTVLSKTSLLPNQKQLSEIVIPSSLLKFTPTNQTAEIVKLFNSQVKHSCFVSSVMRGKQIPQGEFLLGVRNNVPELHGPSTKPIAEPFITGPGNFTKILGKHNQNEPYFGAAGSHVLNVPAGHYALAFSNKMPLIYGEGIHVIHDPTFYFDVNKGLIKQSNAFIQHQTINILRVNAGTIAKIWIGTTPYILPSQEEPYVFVDPNFRFDKKTGFVKESTSYIKHGTIHHIRIPSGKIALVWYGSEAKILEDTTRCYRINDPLFRLQKASATDNFYDATEELIVHGSIKRLLTETGHVAYTYDNGNLKVYGPRTNGKPRYINSPTHHVSGFLNTAIQTREFPSKKTKKQRLIENKSASPDEIAYIGSTTRDSLKVGVKLAVVYKISDPEKAIRAFKTENGILNHIETVTTTDMGKAIQQCTSQELLSSYHNNPTQLAMQSTLSEVSALVPAPILHYQDVVKQALALDLAKYGIELIRLNVEPPKILDKGIQKQMEQQALKAARTNADSATMHQDYLIAQQKAKQEAETRNIEIQQKNDAIKSRAQAELEAAKLQAEAAIVKANGEKQVNEMLGELYAKNPQIFQRDMAKISAGIFEHASLNMTSPEVAAVMGMGNNFGFFRPGPQPAPMPENNAKTSVVPQMHFRPSSSK